MKSAPVALRLLFWSVLLLSWAQGQEPKSGSSCEPALGADYEVVVAARAYQAFLAAELQKASSSGVGLFPGKHAVSTSEKLCREVADKAIAHQRNDIAQAALLLQEAFKHTEENMSLAKAKRTKPANPKLAEIYGSGAGGYTEGELLKGFLVAQLRFSKLLGPTVLTEKDIQAMPDLDSSALAEELKNADTKGTAAREYEELTLVIKNDGSVWLDRKKMESDEKLAVALGVRGTASHKSGKTVRVTLSVEENVSYARVQEMFNVFDKAKIPHVTFSVDDEDF